jgi:Flp pilus assembly protein TadD
LWRLRGTNPANDLRYKDSIPCFDEALRLKPDNANTLTLRILACAQGGDQARAAVDLERLRELDPSLASDLEESL